jgi:N6-adenosine-specific RNA methylase IME4
VKVDLPTTPGGWGTVMADPPWSFNDKGSRLAPERCAATYQTMTAPEILALPVGDVAAPTAGLFVWATDQHTELALQCIPRWGFRFIQFIPWVKVDSRGRPRKGGGHYFRHVHEHCLFAVRGRVKVARRDLDALIVAPRGRHSAKPREIHWLAEQMSPGPRLELFARAPVQGWTCFGNQTGGMPAAPLRPRRRLSVLGQLQLLSERAE